MPSLPLIELSTRTQPTPMLDQIADQLLKLMAKKTTKAVLMIHGISACPQQFADLGDTFFKAGYNVYIPRVPSHGLTDNKRHGEITIPAMAQFMNSSTSIVSGLGEEAGVVGLSGGANMAT